MNNMFAALLTHVFSSPQPLGSDPAHTTCLLTLLLNSRLPFQAASVPPHHHISPFLPIHQRGLDSC